MLCEVPALDHPCAEPTKFSAQGKPEGTDVEPSHEKHWPPRLVVLPLTACEPFRAGAKTLHWLPASTLWNVRHEMDSWQKARLDEIAMQAEVTIPGSWRIRCNRSDDHSSGTSLLVSPFSGHSMARVSKELQRLIPKMHIYNQDVSKA